MGTKLYGEDACPDPQSDSSEWDWGQDGEFRNGRNIKDKLSHSIDTCTCTRNSVWLRGCMLNGNVI